LRYSILHLSDLHRDPKNEVDNSPLFESLARDLRHFGDEEPDIVSPTICVVCGDLVFGIKPQTGNDIDDIKRQYQQAEEFLVRLADEFFDGNRENVIILPGNHDICYATVMGNADRIDIPSQDSKKKELVQELFDRGSNLRWSWDNLVFIVSATKQFT